MREKIVIITSILMAFFIVGCQSKSVDVKEINISVAASLVPAMNEIVDTYLKENENLEININSGGSGTLKKQISEGAEIGLFFSANEKYVDELIEEGLVQAEKKSTPVTNSLVLIKNKDAQSIKTINDLTTTDSMIAIGEVNTVPAGEYAKQAFENLGIWNGLESSLIYGKDVTAVKTYVERGEVDYGVIYKTDAKDLENSSIVMELPRDSYQEINYALAPIEGYTYEKECESLMNFILSSTGQGILESYGFTVTE